MLHFRAEASILVLARISEHAAHAEHYVQESGVVLRDLHGKLSQASWKADGPIGTMRLSAGLTMPDRVYLFYVCHMCLEPPSMPPDSCSQSRAAYAHRGWVTCSFLWSLSYPAVWTEYKMCKTLQCEAAGIRFGRHIIHTDRLRRRGATRERFRGGAALVPDLVLRDAAGKG